jgi:hypothetical protein
MADYQSLLTRAVANLPSTSPAAARQAIYDRARKALLTQLRTLRPPLPESDIEREERALDHAIELVEAKFMAPGEAEAPRAPARPQPAARVPPQGEARVAVSPANPTASPTTAPPPVHFTPARTATEPVSPTRPPRPAESVPRTAAAPASRPQPTRPPAPADARNSAKPGATPVNAPQIHAPHLAQGADARSAAPAVAAKADGASPTPTNLSKVVPSAQSPAQGTAAPPVAVNADADEGAVMAPDVPVEVDRLDAAARPDYEGQRPQAPTGGEQKRRSLPWLLLAILLGVVLTVAGVAIVMRQRPQDLAISPQAEPQQEVQTPPKIAQRAQSTPSEDNTPANPPQAAQPAAPGAQDAANPAPEAQNPAVLPAAARAAMLIASADNPQKPIVNLGSTVWSTIAPTPGQPQTAAVKADADIPDLKMHATMILRKNTDPTLPATHTIDLKFSFADGAPVTGFKDVGLPQMRKLDSTASETLTSQKVKISDEYFLIALANGPQDLARNLDLMATRAWFDFPLLLNDNRIAKLVFQKSVDGDAMLAKALDAWK